jgi:hypothetical protein
MAAMVRQFQSPAQASYMPPEEEEATPAALARAGHLELAAEAGNGTAQRQLLGPQTLVAVVAVRIPIRKENLAICLAQEQAAW